MGRLVKIIDKVLDFTLVGVNSGFLILLTTLTFFEVITRYLFGFATAQVSEYCVFFLVWLSFATAGVALKEKRHIAMGTLEEYLVSSGHIKTALGLDIFINLMVIIFAASFSYLGIVNVKATYSSGFKPLVEYVPRYWIWYLALPVGTITLLYFAFQNLLTAVKQLIRHTAGGGTEQADQESKK